MQVSGGAGGELEDGAPGVILNLDAHAFQHAPRTADGSQV